LASAESSPSRADQWIEALSAARARETAHFEARARVNDAKRLRLQVLKEELSAAVPPLDMTIPSTEPPYLWLDLVTSVVMEPEPGTYRLIEDGDSGRIVVLETADRSAMVDQIRQLMAHRAIAQERRILAPAWTSQTIERYTAYALIVAWLTGFGVAALIFVAIGIYLKT